MSGKPKDWTDEFWDGWVQGRELLRDELVAWLRLRAVKYNEAGLEDAADEIARNFVG